jgi:hypothetical protein
MEREGKGKVRGGSRESRLEEGKCEWRKVQIDVVSGG